MTDITITREDGPNRWPLCHDRERPRGRNDLFPRRIDPDHY